MISIYLNTSMRSSIFVEVQSTVQFENYILATWTANHCQIDSNDCKSYLQ